jgi:hypothetical protein
MSENRTPEEIVNWIIPDDAIEVADKVSKKGLVKLRLLFKEVLDEKDKRIGYLERDNATLRGANTEHYKKISELLEQVKNAEDAEKREIEDWKDLFQKYAVLHIALKEAIEILELQFLNSQCCCVHVEGTVINSECLFCRAEKIVSRAQSILGEKK